MRRIALIILTLHWLFAGPGLRADDASDAETAAADSEMKEAESMAENPATEDAPSDDTKTAAPAPAPEKKSDAPSSDAALGKSLPQDEGNPLNTEIPEADINDANSAAPGEKSTQSPGTGSSSPTAAAPVDADGNPVEEKEDHLSDRLHLSSDPTQWKRFDIINYHRELVHQHRGTPTEFDNNAFSFGGQAMFLLGAQIFASPADKMFFPSFHLQQMVAKHWAVGLKSLFYQYLNYTDLGGIITVTLFFSKAYHGFELEFGAGIASASNGTDSGIGHAISFMGGGQWFLNKTLNLGAKAGFENFNFYPTAGVPQNTALIVPCGEIIIGFAM